MNTLLKIRQKLYYRIASLLLKQEAISLPPEMGNKKNLFIYFDYEREFGGHNTSITDSDISFLLVKLDGFDIKSTWFTVGEIFEKYPNSINDILKRGHEIGSHTYSHIPPLLTKRRDLAEDFRLFGDNLQDIGKIQGFHSPNGLWSVFLLKLLCRHNYSYDLFSGKKNAEVKTYSLKINSKCKISRFVTVGDDWPLYKKNKSIMEILDYFITLSKKIERGSIAGIGFHPWVILSDSKIHEAFILFLDYLNKDEEFNINTASYFLNKINS